MRFQSLITHLPFGKTRMVVLGPSMLSQLIAEMVMSTPSIGNNCLVLLHSHGLSKGQDVGHDTVSLDGVML